MHRSTPEDEFAQTWFDYGRSVFPQSVRKTGTHVELCNVPTYQCSILFNNMGWFNRKSEFRKPQNLNKPVAKGEKFNVADLSLLREFWWNNYAQVFLTAEAGSLSTDAKQLLEDYGFGGTPLKQKQWSVSPCKNWFHRVRSPPVGIKWRRRQKFTCSDVWSEISFLKKQKE